MRTAAPRGPGEWRRVLASACLALGVLLAQPVQANDLTDATAALNARLPGLGGTLVPEAVPASAGAALFRRSEPVPGLGPVFMWRPAGAKRWQLLAVPSQPLDVLRALLPRELVLASVPGAVAVMGAEGDRFEPAALAGTPLAAALKEAAASDPITLRDEQVHLVATLQPGAGGALGPFNGRLPLLGTLGSRTLPGLKASPAGVATVLELRATIDNAFGLQGLRLLNLKSTLGAGAAAGGASLSATAELPNKTSVSGSLLGTWEGNALREVALRPAGELPLGSWIGAWKELAGKTPALERLVLGTPTLGWRPGSGLGFVAGTIKSEGAPPGWSGPLALAVGQGRVTVFVQPGSVNLQELVKPPAPVKLPTLAQSVLVVHSGTGGSVGSNDLPSPVRAMFDAVLRGLPGTDSLPLAEGLALWTRTTASSLGFGPKANDVLVLPELVLGGSIEPGQTMALAAALPADAVKLEGWRVKTPRFVLGYDATRGSQVGVSAVVEPPVRGASFSLLFAAGGDGTLAATGVLDADWRDPLGLQRTWIDKGSGVTLALMGSGRLGLGVQGGFSAGPQQLRNTLLCADFAPGPVVSALGLGLEANTLDPALMLQLVDALGDALAAPMMLPGEKQKQGPALDALRKADLARAAAGLPLPRVDGAKVYLATPGLSCKLDANDGFGARLAGRLMLAEQALGQSDSGFNLQDGFWMRTQASGFKLGRLLELTKARLDAAVPMPGGAARLPHLKLRGEASLGFASGDIDVHFSRQRVHFETQAALADLFTARLLAEAVGANDQPTADLAQAERLRLRLAAGSDGEASRAQLLKALGAALQPTARQFRLQAAARRPAPLDLKKALDDVTSLDQQFGQAYRGLVSTLNNAQACLDGSKAACDRVAGGLAKAAQALLDTEKELRRIADGVARWAEAEARYQGLRQAEAAARLAEELWGGLLSASDALAQGAVGATGAVQVQNLAFDGTLDPRRGSKGRLSVTLKLSPRAVKLDLGDAEVSRQFDITLSAQPTAPAGGPSTGALASDVSTAWGKLRKPEELAPPKLSTWVQLAPVDLAGTTALKVSVAAPQRAVQSQGEIPPRGTVTLYRVASDGTRTRLASASDLNERGSCSTTGSVQFPAAPGSGCTVKPALGNGPFVLPLQSGANVFVAVYEGDAAYQPAESKIVTVVQDASCGSLARLDGARVRLVVPGAPALYASQASVVNDSLNTNAPFVLFEKSSSHIYWDLALQLRAVPGQADQYWIEAVRECPAGGDPFCHRMVVNNGKPVLAPLKRSSTERPWRVQRQGGTSVTISSTCPSGGGTCFLGRNSTRATFGPPGAETRSQGELTLVASPTPMNFTLEELCAAR